MGDEGNHPLPFWDWIGAKGEKDTAKREWMP